VKLLTTKQVILRIAIVIAVVEFLVMSVFSIIRPVPVFLEAVLDPIVLVIFSTFSIYYWIIKPFANERNVALAQVNHLAHTDSLTQLANRRLIVSQLEKLISESIRHKDYSAVLLLDLDGFKKVNDKYGHDAGDVMLIEVAKRLAILIRSEDTVGRIGGDEFVVLINRLGKNEQVAYEKVQQIAKKLIDLICAPLEFQAHTLRVGVSVGVRLLGEELINTEAALREADTAMFQAKKSGGSQVVVFEKEKTAQLF
jgi:two-component system, cell cycle response regulator